MSIKSFVISALMLVPSVSFGQVDSLLYSSIDSLKSELSTLNEKNAVLLHQYELLQQTVNTMEANIRAIKCSLAANDEKAMQLEAGIIQNANNLHTFTADLGCKIDSTQGNLDEQSSILNVRSFWGAIIAALVLIISGLLTILLYKKGSSKIDKLKKQSDKLNEEIVNKFAVEMSDMQKISSSIGALSAAGASTENEQDLIKTLADRITFMEMTLYKMDSCVKGHKQLSRSISQMKNNMLASGYELVDMLGKPYSEGMKATASFEDDDTLDEGVRIITKVIKPQINYKGVMIQNAQITVSQNI